MKKCIVKFLISIIIIFISISNFNVYADKIILGDCNLDGVVDISDTLKIHRHIVALKDSKKSMWLLTGEQKANADVNGDGNINITDYIAVQRYVAVR